MSSALPATFTDLAPLKKDAIQKVRYSHDAMIDLIVANPWVSQGELARTFGYTEGWVSQVIASDAFQSRLAERKNELVDPTIRATIEEKFKGLVERSYQVLLKKLEANSVSDETALRTLEIASRAAGYGSRSAQAVINNNFVVAVPPKAESTAAWAKQHGAGGGTALQPAHTNSPEIQDAILVEPSPAGPSDPKALLNELKGL